MLTFTFYNMYIIMDIILIHYCKKHIIYKLKKYVQIFLSTCNKSDFKGVKFYTTFANSCQYLGLLKFQFFILRLYCVISWYQITKCKNHEILSRFLALHQNMHIPPDTHVQRPIVCLHRAWRRQATVNGRWPPWEGCG